MKYVYNFTFETSDGLRSQKIIKDRPELTPEMIDLARQIVLASVEYAYDAPLYSIVMTNID